MLAALALVACGAGTAARATTNCGSFSAGPGALKTGDTKGAQCFLRAYRSHCAAATYRLSTFGVDTIGTDDFSLVVRAGHCRIDVASSFRVVPQPPHPAMHGVCTTLAARGSDVVASGCTGGNLPPAISLTGAR